ncbi:hypothetical protein ACWM35_14515 [Neobacillus sp. K501]
MNALILQWGLFSFMIGIFLSLPLAAVYYQKNSILTKVFTNARKLKSAHLDFFTQAFAMGFAYLLEFSMKLELPLYVVIPLIFGTIMNPSILLLEATPFIRSGLGKIVYKLLRATSPISLLFAWFAIAIQFLPLSLQLLLLAVVIFGGLLFIFITFQNKEKKQGEDNQIQHYLKP